MIFPPVNIINNELLNREHLDKKDLKLVLNITYQPSFFNLKNVFKEIHLLLTPDEKHLFQLFQTFLSLVLNADCLKDLLVRAKLPTPKVAGKSNGCQVKRCGICPVFVDTKFSDLESTRVYEIMSNLYCEFILIDQCDGIRSLRKRETFWQARLETFLPNGLNEKRGGIGSISYIL